MAYVTLAVMTALCFLLPVTRIYGIVGVGILLYFRPFLTLGLLTLVGIAHLTYRRFFA